MARTETQVILRIFLHVSPLISIRQGNCASESLRGRSALIDIVSRVPGWAGRVLENRNPRRWTRVLMIGNLSDLSNGTIAPVAKTWLLSLNLRFQ